MNSLSYPNQFEIRPYAGPPLDAGVKVPGSKSITNRALVLAALSSRWTDVKLYGVLQSEDTEVMVDCLRRLGFLVQTSWPIVRVLKNANDRPIPAESADLFVGNSGTTVRFLGAVVALGDGTYRLDGVRRMRERPIQDLLDTLNQLGADARSDSGTGCPPITIRSNGWAGGDISVKAGVSSQYLSGLLLAAPFAAAPSRIRIEGPVVSEPYIDMTYRMLCESWLAQIERTADGFTVEPLVPGPRICAEYSIEPDASSASYFFGAAAILGGRVTLGWHASTALQGDLQFAEVLGKMGCRANWCIDGYIVERAVGAPLQGIDIDMNAISDTVMTLAAVACFADGPTRIRNVAHIRHKETDRISALATELRRLGAEVEEFADGLQITPRPLHGATVQTYNDHRMAMSLALIGLKVPGVVIDNPGCVAKTYPGFWQDLERLVGPRPEHRPGTENRNPDGDAG
jgi:3-phosphoshikimate 1-carboxyvinyltransferase